MSGSFARKLLKILYWMRNFTHRWPQSGYFFSKLGHFFPIFKKNARLPPPFLLFSSYASTYVYIYILLLFPWEWKNEVENIAKHKARKTASDPTIRISHHLRSKYIISYITTLDEAISSRSTRIQMGCDW